MSERSSSTGVIFSFISSALWFGISWFMWNRFFHSLSPIWVVATTVIILLVSLVAMVDNSQIRDKELNPSGKVLGAIIVACVVALIFCFAFGIK